MYISPRGHTHHKTSLNLKTNLENHNWSAVLLHTGTQTAYSQFHKEFSHIYDNCFPVRSVKLGYKNRKTWLTQGMKKSIKIKNNLFRQYRQHGTPELEFKYKQYRNNLNRMLRIAEREHYDVLFSNYKGNLKKSWILLKEVINRNKTRDCSSKFLLNGECITDKLKIANGFNSCLRLITHSHRLAHTESLFKELNILTIEKLYVFSVQLFMFKFSNAVIPAVFSDFFVVNADVYDHNTRQRLQYHTPIVHSQQTSRRVRVTGVRAHHIFSSIIGYSCSIGQ